MRHLFPGSIAREVKAFFISAALWAGLWFVAHEMYGFLPLPHGFSTTNLEATTLFAALGFLPLAFPLYCVIFSICYVSHSLKTVASPVSASSDTALSYPAPRLPRHV